MKLTIIIVLCFLSFFGHGQSKNESNDKPSELFMAGWLTEWSDTITLFLNENPVPNGVKYSQLIWQKKSKYDYLRWTGEIAMETPTQFDKQLRIKVKSDKIVFKFGKTRNVYLLSREKSKWLLIKMK